MKFILGKKTEMTQVFLPNGTVVPVTKIVAGPCQIVQVKTLEKDGKKAVQIGFGEKKLNRLNKAEAGHLKNLRPSQFLNDFVLEEKDKVERGDLITVETFLAGDKATVIGISKGKGFAGVVKRHHFGGGPASHGHKDNLRAPGSIGAGGVQRVFKGMRMAGRMGGDRVTVKNLEIIEVRPETNELYIKGAVPGGRNSLLQILAEGELKITKSVKKENSQIKEEKTKTEEQPAVEIKNDVADEQK